MGDGKKPFWHRLSEEGWGVKGLGGGTHLTHKVGSDDFHITTPIRIEGVGTIKVRDYFDTKGNHLGIRFGFTKQE